MKKIECIVREEKLKELTQALREVGIGGMTVSEVRGFGVQTLRPESFLFVHKVKIEIYAADSQVNEIVDTVVSHCASGKLGDGKIAVLPMEDCIRVRTGARKQTALF
ncbi:MAG: hypothetical protein A2Y00_10645 [Omnitrophica WOR_2 bacterium GWF2_43_52]|nr:MAG: hypothetical protein A2Y01_07045 [Omnitrophica WOR_2 bacterium GWC2_44_8]OGX20856.1 MAG: hypothetical protein A2Y00_10645 [Omnitrophica WOR_2 bacterium GWF2_43_52]OGX58633.1 MAG: hypothetical protein A2460_02885 [Omnitrophica WOR_2 bacterium RIFOXYC2_FULL_43_9]HAH19774.1 P-II family nitrogen regulator [Candidatus Omnitrophota bacterium]HBG63399.1 P-II family nitrogen regulator [Candidatus Omnitrophota bacterium]